MAPLPRHSELVTPFLPLLAPHCDRLAHFPPISQHAVPQQMGEKLVRDWMGKPTEGRYCWEPWHGMTSRPCLRVDMFFFWDTVGLPALDVILEA